MPGGPAALLDALEIWKVRQPGAEEGEHLRDLARRVALTEEVAAVMERAGQAE